MAEKSINMNEQDASAGEDFAEGADLQGNQGEIADEEAELLSDEENPDADQEEEGDADEPTEQEADNKATEEKKKGIHQKTLEERAAEIAEKRIAESLAKFKAEQEAIQREVLARQEAEKKPFTELTPEQSERLSTDYANAVAKRLDIEETIRLAEDPQERAAAVVELRRVEKWIADTERWYSDNEAKKAEWMAKRDQKEKQSQELKTQAERLGTTAEVFRVQHNIPQDAWEAGSLWFKGQLEVNPLLGREFADVYRLHGDVAAVRFAHEYITQHMGDKAQKDIKQKEEAKRKLPPGGGNIAVTSDSETARAQLIALHKKAQESGDEADFQAFAEAKRKAGVTGSIFSRPRK